MNLLTLIALLATLIPLAGCASTPSRTPRSYPKTVALLAFDGCPHTPTLRHRLHEALDEAGWSVTVEEVELTDLPDSDPRRHFASPTILVDGSDLFGAPPSDSPRLQCRVYPGGLPTVDAITSALDRRDR